MKRLARKLAILIGVLCIILVFNLLLSLISQCSWNKNMVFSDSFNTAYTALWNGSNLYDVLITQRTLEHQKKVIPKPLFSHPYGYIISNNDFCSRGNNTKERKLALVILVCSSPGNFLQRQTIRETWGSIPAMNNNSGIFRVSFLLGKTNDSLAQRKILEESALYSDIVQEDFSDSYRNLTLKSVTLLKWTAEFCPNVHFVMKADDDIFINIPYLLNVLGQLLNTSNAIYGKIFHKYQPVRLSSSKWFVSKSQYEKEFYPDYLCGAGYVISRDAVPKLLKSSYNLPFLPIEDVFITGMCANKAGIKIVSMDGFFKRINETNGCALKDVITKHGVKPAEMKTMWMELQNKLFCKL